MLTVKKQQQQQQQKQNKMKQRDLICSKNLSEWIITGTTPSLGLCIPGAHSQNFSRGVATKFKVQLICEQQTASLFHGPSLLAAAGEVEWYSVEIIMIASMKSNFFQGGS